MSNKMLDNLTTLADKIAKDKPRITDEAKTRTAFVNPFLKILGYKLDDTRMIVPEYDVGYNKDKKVDYAILYKDKPLVLLEIKHHSEDLDKHIKQLRNYFGVCAECSFGILTNGLEYRFFSNTENARAMDSEPFMVLNLESKIDSESLEILELFKCENLQSRINTIKNKAKKMLEQKEQNAICLIIKDFLENEMKKPSDEFVGFVIDKKFGVKKTTAKIKEFRAHIIRACGEMIDDKVNIALAQNADLQDTSKELSDEENQAFYIVRGILLENPKANLNNICPRGTEKAAYCAVLLDDNKNKWICRLYLKYANKYIETPNATKLPIKDLADIYKYKNELAESLKMRLK